MARVPASWSACMDLIEHAEQRYHERQFTWIVRARPDAYWHHPHPAACSLRPETVYVHIWNDHHFVLPRHAADAVMRGMLRGYTGCAGSFAHETPERWLTATLLHAAGQAAWEAPPCATTSGVRPRGTLQLRQLIFPLALVRANAHEPDAWMLCAQNYIVPYALANASATPCHGDASDRALRRMHAALLACVRMTYPDEAIDGGYHKAHVMLALRKGACPDWLRRSVSP